MAEHFIIVRVKDDQRETMGSVRRSLHDHAEEYALDVADIVLSSDQKVNHYGMPVPPFFDAVKEMFEEHMDKAKAVAKAWRASPENAEEVRRMDLQDKNPAAQEQKRRSRHLARARRAQKVVTRFETTWGQKISG